jgi:isoleucyl-tRNA synthetase
MAALVTDLSLDLINEGLAREFVRRVQALRKDSGFDIADRIRIYYQASKGLEVAIIAFSDYIETETLAVEVLNKEAPKDWHQVKDAFDDESLLLSISKV